MESRAWLLLALLGFFLFAEPGFGQKGNVDISEWMRVKDEVIKSLQDRLTNVEKCKIDGDTLEARLNATKDELTREKAETDKLKEEIKGLNTRLDAAEKEIDKLKQSSDTTAPQIAFSVSLANFGDIYRGPCTDKTLVFKRVFANAGNGYDLNTGSFTAPVNGFYYFSFSTYGYNTHTIGAVLLKNDILQISTYENPSVDGSDSSSNAAVLQLAAGDKLHMELWDNGQVFDNLNGHTTFSGFLLFPV
ncbi:complement C1q tumor necrosis factor-related protein 3-like [Mugil cephalus]|uniref:complement C1q tumor necrosis factor-related protein 3-like n=1 Tax=Mugil cephalus TaxID=48193 RepID=UPI001FB63A1C|nr:complement C1q tumor necrosis factor-related protein 3-like [Mugil cephalus]